MPLTILFPVCLNSRQKKLGLSYESRKKIWLSYLLSRMSLLFILNVDIFSLWKLSEITRVDERFKLIFENRLSFLAWMQSGRKFNLFISTYNRNWKFSATDTFLKWLFTTLSFPDKRRYLMVFGRFFGRLFQHPESH